MSSPNRKRSHDEIHNRQSGRGSVIRQDNPDPPGQGAEREDHQRGGGRKNDTKSRPASRPRPATVGGANDTIPNPDDILMGRGLPYQAHQGNLKMRALVDEYKDRYNDLPRSHRGRIANEILRILRQRGSRFLIRRGGGSKKSMLEGWEIASDAETYEKVCHALRAKTRPRIVGDGTSVAGQRPSDMQAAALPNFDNMEDSSLGANVASRMREPAPSIAAWNVNEASSNRSGSFFAQPNPLSSTHSPIAGLHHHRTLSDSSEAKQPSRILGVGVAAMDSGEHFGTTARGTNEDGEDEDDERRITEALSDADPAVRLALCEYLSRKRSS